MNAVDYWLRAAQAAAIMDVIFWVTLAGAVVAGFLAAWSVHDLLHLSQITRILLSPKKAGAGP